MNKQELEAESVTVHLRLSGNMKQHVYGLAERNAMKPGAVIKMLIMAEMERTRKNGVGR